jgi:hypothetical protein
MVLQKNEKIKPKNTVFYEISHTPMLRSSAKYKKLAKLRHVDSKKLFFPAAAHSDSPGSAPTLVPNRKPEVLTVARIHDLDIANSAVYKVFVPREQRITYFYEVFEPRKPRITFFTRF